MLRAGTIRLSPPRILAAFGIMALLAMAVSAQQAPAAADAAKPKAGDVAPAFTLSDQNGKKHSLSDYRGKWVVVYFYPKDQTPGCTNQACQFTENVFAFRRAGAQILGISVDDEESHKAFEKALAGNEKISAENRKAIEEHGLPFPLLADTTHETAKQYGVLMQRGNMVIANRETFLIDPQGRIARHYNVTPDKLDGHSEELLRDIEALKSKS
jgi:peroxiredoxin Q/BCP|nr:MAG: peroxiredoxin [Pseudomonadota bacterium]